MGTRKTAAKEDPPPADEKATLHVDGDGPDGVMRGYDVDVGHPDKVIFPPTPLGPGTGSPQGITRRELAQYYVDVAPAVLAAVRGRPMILKRYVHGIEAEPFFQKRAFPGRGSPPPFFSTATLSYLSGTTAEEAVVEHAAALVWLVARGCVDFHVHPVKQDDLEHPDELRIDLDPNAEMGWQDVVTVARGVQQVLDETGLVGWPKTSGSRGVHIWVRLHRRWGYDDVRRAALALARTVEQRLPGLATSVWQKTRRHGVLVDYNQNAKDRTTASAWSVRPVADGRVSMPLRWADLDVVDPAAFTLRTVPALFARHGDPHADIDQHPGSLDRLLALADAHEQAEKKQPKKKQAASKPDPAAVVVVAKAQTRPEALAGLARWQQRHADIVGLLKPDDVIVDSMRGKSSAWWRVRVHLRNVPREQWPQPEPPDPDWQPQA